MTSKRAAALLALADRVDRGDGDLRDLEIDVAVLALGFFVIPPRYDGGRVGYGYINPNGQQVIPGHGGSQLVPEFMRSIDAAATLVPEGWEYTFQNVNGYPEATLTNHTIQRTAWSAAGTLPLSITAAALRAHAAQMGAV